MTGRSKPSRRLDADTMAKARRDPGVFAEALVGQPLWDHQLDVVRSEARIRVLCSGRQAGKSRTLAILALHKAFATPEARVLILSAGDDAAKELLSEVAGLAAAPWLSGSVSDDNASRVVLTNGSTIVSVPASTRQVRGRAIDLLILDEGAFMDEALWSAAKWTVIARPGSRVVMSSTPWGRRDRFFAVSYRAGLAGEAGYESFRWPSTASPLVDRDLVETWRRTSTDREFRAEVLAEWVDEQGAYFTPEELDRAAGRILLVPPEAAHGRPASGGVDWGLARDANAVVLVSTMDAMGPVDPFEQSWEPAARGMGLVKPVDVDKVTYVVPWLEEHFGGSYSKFIDRLVAIGAPSDGYTVQKFVSETNGVGAMPTETLIRRLAKAGRATEVEPIHTTAASKEANFGAVKMLLQDDRLLLPRHPGLLRQMAALEFEETDGGVMRIAVPERAGHDDLVLALSFSLQFVVGQKWAPNQEPARYTAPDVTRGVTGGVHTALSDAALNQFYAERVPGFADAMRRIFEEQNAPLANRR